LKSTCSSNCVVGVFWGATGLPSASMVLPGRGAARLQPHQLKSVSPSLVSVDEPSAGPARPMETKPSSCTAGSDVPPKRYVPTRSQSERQAPLVAS